LNPNDEPEDDDFFQAMDYMARVLYEQEKEQEEEEEEEEESD
jgi:hypothetical protein